MALSTITSKQTKATKATLKNVNQVLDYLAINLDATIRFHASDKILNIHFDVYYLSTKSAKSCASNRNTQIWITHPIQRCNFYPLHHPEIFGVVSCRSRVRCTIHERKRRTPYLTDLSITQPPTTTDPHIL